MPRHPFFFFPPPREVSLPSTQIAAPAVRSKPRSRALLESAPRASVSRRVNDTVPQELLLGKPPLPASTSTQTSYLFWHCSGELQQIYQISTFVLNIPPYFLQSQRHCKTKTCFVFLSLTLRGHLQITCIFFIAFFCTFSLISRWPSNCQHSQKNLYIKMAVLYCSVQSLYCILEMAGCYNRASFKHTEQHRTHRSTQHSSTTHTQPPLCIKEVKKLHFKFVLKDSLQLCEAVSDALLTLH